MQASAHAFALEGAPVFCERYGSGHINTTYRLVTDVGHAYILQKINRTAFADIPALMRNIERVTEHLRKKQPDPRRVLTLIPTREGAVFYEDEAGDCWRVYDFITDSLSLDRAESARDFAESAVGIGEFQCLLAGFPAAELSETIPRFHDTPNRYRALRAALEADALGRAEGVRAEIAFALEREAGAGALMARLARGELPLRVTHNDTKLNNVLLDAKTRRALCVIDLDTVMPGLSAFDFGDSIRFGASSAAEDETCLAKVEMRMDLFEAYAEGFLGACGSALTPAELGSLVEGARLMTLECGVRFLADYLAGDVYFHIAHPAHNLDRCRTQFKLVSDMEQKRVAMETVIGRIVRR